MESYKTPIIKSTLQPNGNTLFVKREDLLPFSFGGNKVRIAQEYFEDMQLQGKDCIIGYGNARSNLCRVLANMSSHFWQNKDRCCIVSPADENGERVETNNGRMVTLCGAALRPCTKQNVAETVQAVMEECKERGLSPYYIYGNQFGQGNEAVPVRAYVKVYQEILSQAEELQVDFDYIFLATGTGMTQAGLIAGKQKYGKNSRIVGISVARASAQEKEVILKYLSAYMQTDVNENSEITLTDDYLCGGYGKYTKEVEETIQRVYRTEGMPLDPTYTGKAFYGMEEYLKAEKIQNKNILFIHTGGTPLFFDYLRKIIL